MIYFQKQNIFGFQLKVTICDNTGPGHGALPCGHGHLLGPGVCRRAAGVACVRHLEYQGELEGGRNWL